MTLADKLVQLRKTNGWSQEDLSEKLDVSRQSVSKWESGISTPDIDKIIKLSLLFNISTDYLLKDDIQATSETSGNTKTYENNTPTQIITLNEAKSYINFAKTSAGKVGFGVLLCICSPVLLIFLAGISQMQNSPITEKLASLIGIITLFLMIAVAVVIFIRYGYEEDKYNYMKEKSLSLDKETKNYIVSEYQKNEKKYLTELIIGITLCIISAIPILVIGILELAEYLAVFSVCLLLFIVSIGVFLIIKSGTLTSCFDKLLEKNDYTRIQKIPNKK